MTTTRKLIGGLLATATLLAGSITGTAEANPDPVFADGGRLAGSANGMSFGPDGTLWVANVFGSTITQIDPETGAILSRLTLADGVIFPDDLIVASNGDIYWTNIAFGLVMKKPFGGAAAPLAVLNSANPIALSEDETRLFAAGCYGGPDNDLVEIDPVNGGIVNTYRADVPGCASNGMSWNDGFLYAPQPFEDRILRIDPDSGDITVVTDGWPTPIGTAFDSQGNLYSLAQGVGEVVRIDIDDPDTANNRTVIAEIPFAWADNIAIDTSDNDRIYISSATDSSVSEVLPDGSLRTVVPGQFQLAVGVNVIGDVVYSTHPSGIVAYDRRTGAQLDHYRTPAGVGDLPFVLSSRAWGNELVLMSPLDGSVLLWDPVANVALARTALPGPIDAEPFGDDLLVTTLTGELFRLDRDLNVVATPRSLGFLTGLVADGDDAWAADFFSGTVVQIIDDGVDVAPTVVADGLAGPEGLDIRGNKLYVVEGATGTVTEIQMVSGRRKTVADGLGFQPPLFFPFGLFNNVTVDRGDVFVNADADNIVYRF